MNESETKKNHLDPDHKRNIRWQENYGHDLTNDDDNDDNDDDQYRFLTTKNRENQNNNQHNNDDDFHLIDQYFFPFYFVLSAIIQKHK